MSEKKKKRKPPPVQSAAAVLGHRGGLATAKKQRLEAQRDELICQVGNLIELLPASRTRQRVQEAWRDFLKIHAAMARGEQ